MSESLSLSPTSELVQIDHIIGGVVDDVADDCGAYEAGAAGYQ